MLIQPRRPRPAASPSTHPKASIMSVDRIPTRPIPLSRPHPPLPPIPPVRPAAIARPSSRFSVPRGRIPGSIAAAALGWGQYALLPGSSRLSAYVQSGIYVGLLLLTVCSRRAKVLLIRTLQRYLLNRLFRLLLLVGVNPYGLVILETRGRVSGKIRRVPVGNGRKGDELWIIAEHGTRAGWGSNIRHDPRVRIRLAVRLLFPGVEGTANVPH